MPTLIIQSQIPRGKSMKLNIGDRIKYEDLIYAVVAVIYTTVYLCTVNDDSTDYDYEVNEVYKKYRNIEFLGKR